MWIPYTVPRTLLRLLPATTDEDSVPRQLATTNEEALGETVDVCRRIRSGDFSWMERMPASLRSKCLDVIGRDLARYRPLHKLIETITPMNAVYLADTLDTTLPIVSVVDLPWDEYWRRRYVNQPPDQFPPSSVQSRPALSEDPWLDQTDFLPPRASDADGSIRSSYLTRIVRSVVENLEPPDPGTEYLRTSELKMSNIPSDELGSLLDACGPHVYALECEKLRARPPDHTEYNEGKYAFDLDSVHADLGPVLDRLRNVRRVRLVYGQRVSLRDADALGRELVAVAGRLDTLAVTDSDGLDACKIETLSRYLERCAALARVDFSGCGLESRAGKSVANYASAAPALVRLDLSYNNVGPDGVKALADAALRRRARGYPAVELNLNMNRINDIGAKYLASTLQSGLQPFTKLQIRNCNISEIGGMDIIQSLAHDQGLHSLEIDCNELSLKVAIALYETMKTNTKITYLTTHDCGFPNKISKFLRNVVFHNRSNKRSQMIFEDISDLCNELDEENISLEKTKSELNSEEEDKDD